MGVGNTIGSTDWQAGFDRRHHPRYYHTMKPWFVYLLRCADDTLYCGITTDLKRRLTMHNKGTASKYTRVRRPVVLAAWTEVEDKSSALKLEIKVKKQPRKTKINFLISRGSTNYSQ